MGKMPPPHEHFWKSANKSHSTEFYGCFLAMVFGSSRIIIHLKIGGYILNNNARYERRAFETIIVNVTHMFAKQYLFFFKQ